MTARAAETSTVSGLTWVTSGTLTANAGGYLMAWAAARWLGLDGYSEFAVLLAVQLVLVVPAFALQNVVARETVAGTDDVALRLLSLRCAVIVAVLSVAAVPIVVGIFHVGVLAAAAALATAPAAVVLFGEQGILQGRGKFRQLGILLACAGLARVVPAIVALGVGGGTATALLLAAIGTASVAVVGRLIAGKAPGIVRSIGQRAVFAASQLQLAIAVLSSIDLLLARVVLTPHGASLYGLGAVATKIAFWLPQAISIVFYPSLADGKASARALRSSLALLVGSGIAVVGGIAVCAPIVPTLVSAEYSPVVGSLWLFALEGALLAVVQGTLVSAVAVNRSGVAAVAWVGVLAEGAIVAGLTTMTVDRLLVVAVATVAGTAVITTFAAVRLHANR